MGDVFCIIDFLWFSYIYIYIHMITDFVLPRRFSHLYKEVHKLTLLNLVWGEENPPNLNMNQGVRCQTIKEWSNSNLILWGFNTLCFTQPPSSLGRTLSVLAGRGQGLMSHWDLTCHNSVLHILAGNAKWKRALQLLERLLRTLGPHLRPIF